MPPRHLLIAATLLLAAPVQADEAEPTVSEPLEDPAAESVITDEHGIPILEGDVPLECPTDADDGRYATQYADSGKRHEKGVCRNGLAVRTWNSWYDNGVKAWKGFMEQGLLAGQFESWYDTGQRRARAQYVDGLLHGDVTLWWPDGTIRGLGAYEEGLAQGCHARWHDNGKRASRGAYLDGEKVGRWYYWDGDGTRSKDHHGGIPIKGRCWIPVLLP